MPFYEVTVKETHHRTFLLQADTKDEAAVYYPDGEHIDSTLDAQQVVRITEVPAPFTFNVNAWLEQTNLAHRANALAERVALHIIANTRRNSAMEATPVSEYEAMYLLQELTRDSTDPPTQVIVRTLTLDPEQRILFTEQVRTTLHQKLNPFPKP